LQAHIQRIGIGGPFRDTPRERKRRALALQYTLGLLLPGERKSMQPSMARVPEAQYEAIQNFITNSPWDWRESQGRLLDLMARELGSPRGILILDDVPLVKKGRKSPGVSRQYCGVTGHVDNCQAVVDTFYLRPGEGRNRESVGFCFALDLYLPKAWAEDPERCREAGIPLPMTFREKWRIGLEQLDRARAQGVPHRAILADCGYGDAQEFRAELRRRGEAYVMEVTASEVRVVSPTVPVYPAGDHLPGRRGHRRLGRPHLPDGVPTLSAEALAREAKDWVTIRWGDGTKGPLEGRFTRRKVRVCRGDRVPTKEIIWLLMEDHPEGLRSWICWGLEKASLQDQVAIAHGRWAIGTCSGGEGMTPTVS
jgi:SRSO17 transposase